MRCKKRKFYEGDPQHIYQRTLDGFLIFYDLEDYLVFYTVFSSSAGKFNVNILELCLMPDHVHSLIVAENKREMSAFVGYYTSVFVKEANRDVGRKGPLFEKAYGSAPKSGDKKIRTVIPYIFNNPVEKKLCRRAEDYRWNFLAYAVSENPFVERKGVKKFSKNMRKIMKEVELCNMNGWYLKYSQLRRMFRKISKNEKEILVDFIISVYSPFDYKKLISYYGNYETMLLAVNSVTGAEYDLRETYYPHSDLAYGEVKEYLQEEMGYENVRKVTVLLPEEKIGLAKRLQCETNASPLQIRKFLHISPCPAKS